MPRPSNKEQIRRAALECFAERGYDGTRIADIARRAGVSVAALYNHYRSVQDLAEELYLTNFVAYADELAGILSDVEDVEEAARLVIQATLARYRHDPAAFTFVTQRLPTFLRTMPEDVVLPLTSLQHLVERGQRSGTVRPGVPVLIASLFLGALLRVFYLNDFTALHGFTLTVEHDRTIEDACLAILRPEAGVR